MTPYRICTKCEIHHYENCGSCFGYGVRLASEAPTSAFEADALRKLPKGHLHLYNKACPECGSTAYGIPEKVTE